MNIGETIKRLRKQKDMTQEQLAGYLSISPQAVSRWEINSTLPDITLIPMLANIFGVTTDVLLGVDIDAKEKRIEAIRAEAEELTRKRQYGEAEKLLRNGLKEYPNSYVLMSGLTDTFIVNPGYRDENRNEENNKIREEIITLSEKIHAECTDDNLRYRSIQNLCRAYASMGETDKAVSFAKKFPNTTERDMITETLKGTKKYDHMRDEIARSAFEMLNSIGLLMSSSYVSLDDGTEPYNTDERIMLHHKKIDIVNILIEEGSFGDFYLMLSNDHWALTFLYAQKNDAAATLNHFRLAAKYAVFYDSVNHQTPLSETYTCLLFKGISFPFNTCHAPYMASAALLEESRKLEALLPASELEEIRDELRKQGTNYENTQQ